ncbi:MAG: gliding motility-associated C-terminal domain-containing protein [Ferruginibacter sp.]|nr:gliding motility-associated C-terminal domain-containing protein [Ferruginibacter sp.]
MDAPAGLNNPFIAALIATLSHDETFTLMVMDVIGCFAFDTVRLRVFNGPTIYVPTAFTPNTDGLNDIFRPITIGISGLKYFCGFSRYGELMYETHEFKKGWDGS